MARCLACLGKKKVMQLGLIEGDCKACDGTGKHLDKENEELVSTDKQTKEESDPKEETLIPKKRGRPARNKDDV